jgi:DNA-binding LytR/AlgR family response regulator
MTIVAPTALIAEDEPLLAQSLVTELSQAWPELQVLAVTGDGISAVEQSLTLLPNILFFDIRMPGLNGLEAAADIADQWPANKPLPFLVFITAFDEYAVKAFEQAAVDFLVKPLQSARLHQSLRRIKPLVQKLIDPSADDVSLATVAQLRDLLGGAKQPTTSLLQRLPVSIGSTIVMVPINEVLYFEAADKYVRVITASKEYLIRTPIKDLLPQLDPVLFWQIHRSTIVRASAIESVKRDDTGRLKVGLSENAQGQRDSLIVSRLFAHLFKAM